MVRSTPACICQGQVASRSQLRAPAVKSESPSSTRTAVTVRQWTLRRSRRAGTRIRPLRGSCGTGMVIGGLSTRLRQVLHRRQPALQQPPLSHDRATCLNLSQRQLWPPHARRSACSCGSSSRSKCSLSCGSSPVSRPAVGSHRTAAPSALRPATTPLTPGQALGWPSLWSCGWWSISFWPSSTGYTASRNAPE